MYYRNINATYDLGVILEICTVVWTCGGKVGISKGTSISFNNALSPNTFLSSKAGKVERSENPIRRYGKPCVVRVASSILCVPSSDYLKNDVDARSV